MTAYVRAPLSPASAALGERAHAEVGRGVYAFFVVQVISLVFLQKIGLSIGDKVMALCLPVFLASLGVLSMVQNRVAISPMRLVLYLFFLASALLSQVWHGRNFSVTSMGLLLALYVPFIFRYEVEEALFLRCLRFYQKTMLVVAGIVFLQQISQRLWGFHVWPDMNRMVPPQFLIPNFNYWREMGYGVGIFQPNAFFFLEVSIVSQFLAIALVIEYIFLKRMLWMALFGVALILTFAGTGLLMMTFTAPFLLRKASPRLLMVGALAAVIAGFVGVQIGWFDQVGTRIAEIQQPGTSGYYRFVVPYESLVDAFKHSDSLMFGVGAGAQVETSKTDVVTLPINKLLGEYGLITTVAFFLLFCFSLFERAPSAAICAALFVYFHICGGTLAVPVYVLSFVLFGTLLRIRPGSEQRVEEGAEYARVPHPAGRRVSVRVEPRGARPLSLPRRS